MTLVFSTNDGVSAVVLGDVLITSRSGQDITSHLRVESKKTDWVIDQLVSKVLILRSNLAIAWTGNKAACLDAIRQLDTQLPQTPTFDDLSEAAAKYDFPTDAKIIGSIFSKNEIFTFSYDLTDMVVKRGRSFVEGTGADSFRQVMALDVYSYKRKMRREKRGGLGVGRLALWTLHRMSALPILELTGFPTLENAFGCGYDFVTSIGQEFFRIGSLYLISYQVTIVRRENQLVDFLLRPMDFMITQTYQDDGTILLQKINIKFLRAMSARSKHHVDVISRDVRQVTSLKKEDKHRSLGNRANFTHLNLFFERAEEEGVYFAARQILFREPNNNFNTQLFSWRDDPDELFYVFSFAESLLQKIEKMVRSLNKVQDPHSSK